MTVYLKSQYQRLNSMAVGPAHAQCKVVDMYFVESDLNMAIKVLLDCFPYTQKNYEMSTHVPGFPIIFQVFCIILYWPN